MYFENTRQVIIKPTSSRKSHVLLPKDTRVESPERKIYQWFRSTCVYIACREAGMVRSLEEISKSIDTNHIFSGKCFRFLSRRLGIKTPQIDSRPLLSRIANNARVSEKSLRKAAQMMSVIKENSI